MPFQPRDLIVQAPPLKPKKAQWRVRAPIRWGPYQIPESATTDFASIPKVLWWILPPWERTYVRPAVLHDFLSRPPEDPSLPQVPPVPQHEADRAFRLYEEFRPEIPPGKRGWGAVGELDLDRIRSLG